MYLSEVKTAKQEHDFLKIPVYINQSDPEWIRPLDKDIVSVFDRKKNKMFCFGELKRWILFDDHNNPSGRIAAFVNKKYKNKGDGIKVGGIGFFDCQNDQDMADMLFNKSREWLSEKGVKAMDGPINFGERNMWWGLLVDGFYTPLYGMNYNPPYYKALFENYGFSNFYNQICWSLPVANEKNQLQEKFYLAHEKIAKFGFFGAKTIGVNEEHKFAHDFSEVYNKAWAKHEGQKEISERHALLFFRKMKPIIDEDLLWFTFYKNKPVAMWISIPDINQAIKNLNGKFDLWRKLKFLRNKKLGCISRIVGMTYGIVPEFQGSGIDYYMIVEAEKSIKLKKKYNDIELQWQGDFNPKILDVSRNLGASESRRLVTYRFLFDKKLQFHRHPILH